MIGFVGNIEKQTIENTLFRRVVYTSKHDQLVVMSLLPEEDIGSETHKETDQFFRLEEGTATVVLNGINHKVGPGDAFIVPAGTEHNVINTSKTDPVRLYTVYSHPKHKPNTVHKTKAAALAEEK